MVADLEKGQKSVSFMWTAGCNLVTIQIFNLDQQLGPIKTTYERLETARAMWDKLVLTGYQNRI